MAEAVANTSQIVFGSLDVSSRLVGFQIGDVNYGLAITQVREILPYEQPTSVPTADGALEGVLSIRGETVPIVSLRGRMAMPTVDADRETSIILCDLPVGIVGYTVDRVSEILQVEPEDDTKRNPTLRAIQQAYVERVAKVGDMLVVVLNPE